MWTDRQFWLDSSWRAFRTFCQSLAGLLLAVQTSTQVAAMPEISVPWYGYLYASGIAALVSLLQSVDRERAVAAPAAEPTVTAAESYTPAYEPVARFVDAPQAYGCGDSLR